MPDWLNQFFQKAVSFEVALPIFIAAIIISLAPELLPEDSGAKQIRSFVGPANGIAMVFSGTAILSQGIVAGWRWLTKHFTMWRNEKRLRWQLHDLLPSEKEILRPFIHEQRTTIAADLSDGTIRQLENKMIIMRPSNVSLEFYRFEWVLQPWAREYLAKNPELLDNMATDEAPPN